MSSSETYLNLNVWIGARKLSKKIYVATSNYPGNEQFGLMSQMRRCAVSVPSNIAEGCGRNHSKDSLQFFYIARGSLYELETQLYLSFDLDYIDNLTLADLLNDIKSTRKLLSGFINYYQKLKK